jgi:hypothetical protein
VTSETFKEGVEVTGAFTELPLLVAPSNPALKSDALTRTFVSHRDRWRTEARPSHTDLILHVEIVLDRLTTTYYGTVRPGDKNDREGTMEQHESRHRQMARRWWTQRTVDQAIEHAHVAFTLAVPKHADHHQHELSAKQQINAVLGYLMALHDYQQEIEIDGGRRHDGRPSRRPWFGGIKGR